VDESGTDCPNGETHGNRFTSERVAVERRAGYQSLNCQPVVVVIAQRAWPLKGG
jgi:hypothetical protein